MINDAAFMKLALDQAQRALKIDEIPIGAIIVGPEGKILGRGYNRVEKNLSQSRHAEVIAVERAGKKLQNWRLEKCTVYVTLEPCLMCMSLLGLSRVERLVYGAKSHLFGFDLDKEVMPSLYKKHIKGITGGVMEDEAVLLLKTFFKKQRKTGE